MIFHIPTLAKNLISCSCGERSVFPLAAMASAFRARAREKKKKKTLAATDRIA